MRTPRNYALKALASYLDALTTNTTKLTLRDASRASVHRETQAQWLGLAHRAARSGDLVGEFEGLAQALTVQARFGHVQLRGGYPFQLSEEAFRKAQARFDALLVELGLEAEATPETQEAPVPSTSPTPETQEAPVPSTSPTPETPESVDSLTLDLDLNPTWSRSKPEPCPQEESLLGFLTVSGLSRPTGLVRASRSPWLQAEALGLLLFQVQVPPSWGFAPEPFVDWYYWGWTLRVFASGRGTLEGHNTSYSFTLNPDLCRAETLGDALAWLRVNAREEEVDLGLLLSTLRSR